MVLSELFYLNLLLTSKRTNIDVFNPQAGTNLLLISLTHNVHTSRISHISSPDGVKSMKIMLINDERIMSNLFAISADGIMWNRNVSDGNLPSAVVFKQISNFCNYASQFDMQNFPTRDKAYALNIILKFNGAC